MIAQPDTRVTGFVMPVGNGGVGKTSVTRVLDRVENGGESAARVLRDVRKTKNLEFEYVTTRQTFDSTQYTVTLQFLVPPGQKQTEGDPTGRSFEKVIEIYESMIRRVDVVLFTYDLARRESFDDLSYWVKPISALLNDRTHFILLGTHLDQVGNLEVNSDDIQDGLEYLRKSISTIRPGWRGSCTRLEVSNLTGENLGLLLHHLAGCVVRSRLMISMEFARAAAD